MSWSDARTAAIALTLTSAVTQMHCYVQKLIIFAITQIIGMILAVIVAVVAIVFVIKDMIYVLRD